MTAAPRQRRHHWLRRGLTALALLALAAVPVVGGSVGSVQAQGNAPVLEVVSPSSGGTIASNTIQVQVKVSNFKLDCAQAGRPDQAGVGHIHAMIDGNTMAQLANFYCADTFTIPGNGVKPGKHTLVIALASNTHMDMMSTAKEVSFDFAPPQAIPLPASNYTGVPGVQLVSPTNGATVPAKFTVEVKPIHFTPSAALEGKGNVPGYGHYHVFVDTPMRTSGMGMMGTPESGMMGSPAAKSGMMGMMSMAGMVLMPGTNGFPLDLSAWGKGAHTIWIEPVQDDHTQYQQFGHVEFKVNVQ